MKINFKSWVALARRRGRFGDDVAASTLIDTHRPDGHDHQGRRHGAVYRQRVELQQNADWSNGLFQAHQRSGRHPRS